MAELSKDMMMSIDNYGDRIKTLKDFVTSVRKRPTMYLGSLHDKGLLNAMREIFQNSIDQIVDPLSPGSWFSFYYDERTGEVVVEDNGLGLPPNDIIRILTAQHTSKNYEKKLFEYSSGYNGVGSKIVNALSDTYIVESYKYDGTAVRVEFKKGYATSDKPKPIPNKEKKQGCKTTFIMDEEIMGEMHLPWKEPYILIKRILSTLPLGTTCYFGATDINGVSFTEEIVNRDGIITDLITKVKRPIIKPIVIRQDDGIHKLECAFCYDAGDENGPSDMVSVTSFTNMCPTIGGTHVDGTLEGITRWFSQYMNNVYLINQKVKDKSKALKVVPADIKFGLNIFLAAAHLEPQMNDQAKEIMGNQDMIGFCKEVIMKGLDEWSKANPQDLAKLSKFFKEVAELRQRSEASKAKIATKFQQNAITGLPSKYIRPLGKEGIELIIVEGDSALGTATTGRDKQTQGLFPIRGKIINAFKTSRANFFSNEEVQGITRIILGSDYKRGFDVKDCKVSKVIFMADADVDRRRTLSENTFRKTMRVA